MFERHRSHQFSTRARSLGWPDAPTAEAQRKTIAAYAQSARRLEGYKADLIIAFLDDYFENHFRNPMPTFSVAVAPSHSSPADYMMEALRFDRKAVVPGEPELAETILNELVHSDSTSPGWEKSNMAIIFSCRGRLCVLSSSPRHSCQRRQPVRH